MLLLFIVMLQAVFWTTPVYSEETHPPQRGMWVWHLQCYATRAKREQLIQFCKSERITLLLVQVHYDMDRRAKTPRGLRRPQAYGDLIQKAREAGISVEALEGDPEWSHPAGQGTFWPKLKVILDWYKAQPPNRRFAGLHLDVEPYLLSEFQTTHKLDLLRGYLQFMAQARDRVKQCDPSLIFAADIPFWYDVYEEDEYLNHCVLEFHGKKKYASSHLQDICDYVGIMSYRRNALGENSITRLCEGELAYAEKIGKKIFCGVETSPGQDPPTISFYGTDPPLFREQLALVEKAFRGRPGFGGILIHHYLSYQAFLRKRITPLRPALGGHG